MIMRKLVTSIINLGVDPDTDLAEIRKIRFLNFTCSLSLLINILNAVVKVSDGSIYPGVLHLAWAGILSIIVFLNYRKLTNVGRILFLFLWIGYILTSFLNGGNESNMGYWLLISILIGFVLFDSIWTPISIFFGLYLFLFGWEDILNDDLGLALRFITFFIIVAFFKRTILGTEETARKKQQEAADAEKKQLQNQQQMIAAELEHKNRELINFATSITQRNEFIESLNEQLSELKNSGNEVHFTQLQQIVAANNSITKDREEFEAHVQSIYAGFFSRLDQLYPDISISEKRLATLLRLELSSKQISTILNISPKSVDQSRYRLRKKMDLDSKANLVHFLQSL